MDKKVYRRGVLERVGRVTVNTIFFRLIFNKANHPNFKMPKLLVKILFKIIVFSGPHFRLPRFDSPLTTPSEVKINGRRILPVINYYIKKNALFVKCLYPRLYPVVLNFVYM